MDWIKELLETYTDAEGKVDDTAFIEAAKKEFPKHAVVKSVYNSKAKEAGDLQTQLNELQGKGTDAEQLRKERDQLKEELQKERISHKVQSALTEAGGEDLDYLTYKLGDLELDENGNVKDLDNKIKELKDEKPAFFAAGGEGQSTDSDPGAQDEGEQGDNGEGQQPIIPQGWNVNDNRLDDGDQKDPQAAAAAEFERALGLETPTTDDK